MKMDKYAQEFEQKNIKTLAQLKSTDVTIEELKK